MYKCHDCGSEFDQPYRRREYHGLFDGPPEIFLICPDCGSGRFEPIENTIDGYVGFGKNDGIFVPRDEAFSYAAGKCGITKFDPKAPDASEFVSALVEWYFSGEWTEQGGE